MGDQWGRAQRHISAMADHALNVIERDPESRESRGPIRSLGTGKVSSPLYASVFGNAGYGRACFTSFAGWLCTTRNIRQGSPTRPDHSERSAGPQIMQPWTAVMGNSCGCVGSYCLPAAPGCVCQSHQGIDCEPGPHEDLHVLF
jgi:hypothetical protein